MGQLSLKCKKSTIDCKQLCSREMAKIVVPLHVVTGCDKTSSFSGIGERTVWKRVKKSVAARQLLSNLTQESLHKFIIRYIYNDKRSNTLGEMRAKSMKTKKAKSIARFGPDRNSNYYRNQRVIYHVNVLLNFQNSSAPPSPLNENGYFIQNGIFAYQY